MFRATKPFKDTITGHDKEPSLRIGRTVPKDAVNIAYYYNPTATDAERVMTAEAPAQTIDHRVEDAYRYLTDQAAADDDLFPQYVPYEDDEGYSGKLGRMYTNWYPKNHVDTRQHIEDRDYLLHDRHNYPKGIEYKTQDGYEGLLMDNGAPDYTVQSYKHVVETKPVDRNILNYELDYREIFGSYCPQNKIDTWGKVPTNTGASTTWPTEIRVTRDTNGNMKATAIDGDVKCRQQVANNATAAFDEAVGTLKLDPNDQNSVHREPVVQNTSTQVNTPSKKKHFFIVRYKIPIKSITDAGYSIDNPSQAFPGQSTSNFKTNSTTGNQQNGTTTKYIQLIRKDYLGNTNNWIDKTISNQRLVTEQTTNNGNSTEVNDFFNDCFNECSTDPDYPMDIVKVSGNNETVVSVSHFKQNNNTYKKLISHAASGDYEIRLFCDSITGILRKSGANNSPRITGTQTVDPNRNYYFVYVKYSVWQVRKVSSDGRQYDVTANYKGILSKDIQVTREEPETYKVTVHYVGVLRKVWQTFDGMAYYRGSVTKSKGIGSINPEGDDTILMYPDNNGYLRKKLRTVKQNGEVVMRDDYKVESEQFYITDVFKDGQACFYKYPLKRKVYDYRGPDEYGFYEGLGANVYTNAMKDIPKNYVFGMKLEADDMETVSYHVENNNGTHQTVTESRPSRYTAYLYTSFLSTSTDTYKVVYNAFNDKNKAKIEMENGVVEEVYNYPFMYRGFDYEYSYIDEKVREVKIKLYDSRLWYLDDSRRKVTFTWKVVAAAIYDANEVVRVESEEFTSSIINRDYAVESEYKDFVGRGYIISPYLEDGYQSPYDILIRSEARRVTDELANRYQTDPALAGLSWNDPLPVGYQAPESKINAKNYKDFVFFAEIVRFESETANLEMGSVNLICNPDGSGLITAETTVATGFYDNITGDYTKKLNINNPYIIEEGRIYPGYMVKCIDTKLIKVNAPREQGLLESWYPMIQFGHYSQIMSQYGDHIKVSYVMPEYNKQEYSKDWGRPYMDVKEEQAEILNKNMIRTKKYPIYLMEPEMRSHKKVYRYNNKAYSIFKESGLTWEEAAQKCEAAYGNLAMPKSINENVFINKIAEAEGITSMYFGIRTYDDDIAKAATPQETQWYYADGTMLIYDNWHDDEPNNIHGDERYGQFYVPDGDWNDVNSSAFTDGFICEYEPFGLVVRKKVNDNEYIRIPVRDVSYSDGVIILGDDISENDNIVVNYTYHETNYVYRGYWRNEADFVRLDLNPNMYHTYNDPAKEPSVVSPTKNLFNHVIYFFMKPTAEYDMDVAHYENVIKTRTEVEPVPAIPEQREEAPINIDLSDQTAYTDGIRLIGIIKDIGYEGPLKVEGKNGHWNGFFLLKAPKGTSESEDLIRDALYFLKNKVNVDHGSNIIPDCYIPEFYELLKNNGYNPELYFKLHGNLNAANLENTWVSYDDPNVSRMPIVADLSHTYDYWGIDTAHKYKRAFYMDSKGGLLFYKKTDPTSINGHRDTFKLIDGVSRDAATGEVDLSKNYAALKSTVPVPAGYDSIWKQPADKSIFVKDIRIDNNRDFNIELQPGNPWRLASFSLPLDNAMHDDNHHPTAETDLSVSIPRPMQIDNITLDQNYIYAVVTTECSTGNKPGFDYKINLNGTKVTITPEVPATVRYVEKQYTEQEWVEEQVRETKYANVDWTLYHQIDNYEPASDHDIYIGSVFIRQNTSLHSTILTDGRTRGGGIIQNIKDSVRRELEPESDWYLDIGYYDGEPYQENGIIIIRLDNRVLKEHGGRFTDDDVRRRVKDWLGYGIFPIIEYVDAYTKNELPQHWLEVEESYSNVIGITPEFTVEHELVP